MYRPITMLNSNNNYNNTNNNNNLKCMNPRISNPSHLHTKRHSAAEQKMA